MAYRVRVSGLPFRPRPDSVMRLFSGPTDFVPVRSATGKELGQAFVSFPDVEAALTAVSQVDGQLARFGTQCVRLGVSCDFQGPRIVQEVIGPKKPNSRQLIRQVRDKAVGAKWPMDPVMATTNESHSIRRYKTGGLPRGHDRQR